MTIIHLIAAFVAGIGIMLLALSLKNYRQFYLPNWLLRMVGETPWAPGVARHMRAVPSGALQPTHQVYFVNRQDIAECGLSCPKCATDVAERGDFSRVVRSVIDGQVNECIKCVGLIDMNDGQKPIQCPAWLAASPNTEHGDDLIEGDPPEFYVFTRIAQAQALREKYGMEISADDVSLMAEPRARPSGSIPGSDILNGTFVPFEQLVEQAKESGEIPAAPAPVVPFSEQDTRILPTISDPSKDT